MPLLYTSMVSSLVAAHWKLQKKFAFMKILQWFVLYDFLVSKSLMNKCLRYFLFVANSEISGFEVFCIFLQAFIANSMHLVKNHCIWKDIVFLISYLILISSRYLVVSLMWLYQPPIIKLQKQFENCKLFALMMKTWQSLLYSNTMFVCMLAAYLLQNGWTDLAKLFFVSSVLVTRWF